VELLAMGRKGVVVKVIDLMAKRKIIRIGTG
jgi:hypothetical protein